MHFIRQIAALVIQRYFFENQGFTVDEELDAIAGEHGILQRLHEK